MRDGMLTWAVLVAVQVVLYLRVVKPWLVRTPRETAEVAALLGRYTRLR